MHTLSAWFTRNPVAANLLMLLVLVAGLFSLQSIRIEGFPALPPSSITITTIYPGSSAEQVDRGISRKIKKALAGMPGVKKIASFSEENSSSVLVQKISGYDMDRFHNDIKSRIEAISHLPQLAERPIITRDELTVEALLVQVYGNIDDKTLQRVSRMVQDELQAHPQITKLSTFGLLPYEVRIEVDDEKLRTYGLSLDDIAQAIERSSLDYRTGNLRSHQGVVIIRADHKAFDVEEFSSIPILTPSDGTRILIKDVATVVDGFSEVDQFAHFQQMPSVGMQLFTGQKGHLLEISKAAHQIIEKIRPQLPHGIHIDIWGEYSIYMKERLALLASNAWQGLLIVFVLLALFLNLKLAFWVAMGIPISLASTIMLMGDRFLGYSLNDITTFGMIIVLGILVDDAVVVGESVFEQRSKTTDPIEGTIKGVHRVSTATIFGALTTIAAFYPLLLIDNDIGRIFASFSVVAIISLLASLIESKLILPAHLAAIRIDSQPPPWFIPRLWHGLQNSCSNGLNTLNMRLYKPLLERLLQHRYAALLFFATVAICGFSIITNGWVRTVFFPDVPGQIITVELKMHHGTPLNVTLKNIETIEQTAQQLNHNYMIELGTTEPPIMHLMTSLNDPYSATFFAELQPEKLRKVATMATLESWRNAVGQLEGVEKLQFSGSFETGGGFILELGAKDELVLKSAVEQFTAKLGSISGIHDVRSDLQQGSPQIRLHLKPEAQHLGLTTQDLAQQIGDAFGGLEVQRMQRGSDEVKVYVKFAQQRRRYMQDILKTNILTNSGQWVPLSLVASIESGYVPTAINRQNGHRVVQVRATLDKKQISTGEAFTRISKEIVPQLTTTYPSLTIKGAGELEEIEGIKGGMTRALIMIIFLIYSLLAIPLKSYWQPLVIMSVIPFSFIGATLGHWIMGTPLSILSFFGMLAVTGIVVNDSLVMLTQFNELHRQGKPLQRALIEAGVSRFRPIFLTTITTVCGLLPLLLETSEQAQYLIPAAISLVWGELFTTPITLLIVPLLINSQSDFIAAVRSNEQQRI